MAESLVVFIEEAASMVGVSESTISRWCAEGLFVRPISLRGGKRRWLRSDIETFLASQSTATSPVPARKQRRNTKAFEARQAATDRALQRYRKGGLKLKYRICTFLYKFILFA
jgi:predicted DNA-binding transcriptional regulator AlpA